MGNLYQPPRDPGPIAQAEIDALDALKAPILSPDFDVGLTLRRDVNNADVNVLCYSDTAASAGNLTLRHAGGNEAAPVNTKNGFRLGSIQYFGFGSIFRSPLIIEATAAGDFSDANLPTNFSISKTASVGVGRTPILSFDASNVATFFHRVDFPNAGFKIVAGPTAGALTVEKTAIREIRSTYGESTGVWNHYHQHSTPGAEAAQRFEGRLFPIGDALWDIGASTLRWLMGHFMQMRLWGLPSGVANSLTFGYQASGTATTGASGALPAQPSGYIVAYLGTAQIKIPYYNP